ncbi:MAG: right-handed parallel beta-helix repeat-containing protein [Akkermansiaceae bacterium]
MITSKSTATFLLSTLATTFTLFAATPADFYLSPQGSDKWSGTLAEPNATKTDGPFATLEHTRDAVRELKKTKSTNINILIRGGNYTLNKTVTFGLPDSGTPTSNITYSAYPSENPIFSSGQEIKDWKKVTTDLPGLPAAAKGQVWEATTTKSFLTLYDREGMLPRSRSEKFTPTGKANQFDYPKGFIKDWSNVEDLEVLVRPSRLWTMNILPLKSVDETKRIAHTKINATYGIKKYGAWLENSIELLDKQGEWALNTKTNKVYLWPRSASPVFAPTLIEYILIEGKIDKQGPTDTPVQNLHFRGLTFKNGERYTLEQGDQGTQHDWDMFDKANTLVRLRGAENCSITDCHFQHSGSGAIRIDLHGQKNTLSGNHIEYMGGGGILLCGYGPGTKDVNKQNTVTKNHIHHISEIYWQSPGIFLCQSGENKISNNLIHHANYSGMIVAGIVERFMIKSNKRESSSSIRWHEIKNLPKNYDLEDIRPYLHTHDNIVEYNEIHNVMQILGDGNGIYVRGCGANNIFRGNYIHHLVSNINGQSAIRTDGGQKDTLFIGNLIYKCKSQGVTIKLNNRFENNIIADVIAPRGIYLKIVEGPSNGATNKNNIFYSTLADCTFISEPGAGKGLVGEDRRGRSPARMKDFDSDNNIYYCKADPKLGQAVLTKLQKDGVDKNSLSTAPLFTDPQNGDFTLQPNSPALKQGTTPFDLSKVGLRPYKK